MQGHNPEPELEAIRRLLLEGRYVWRVASALNWAFRDLDDLSVSADKDTMTPEDFAKVVDLLKLRPGAHIHAGTARQGWASVSD